MEIILSIIVILIVAGVALFPILGLLFTVETIADIMYKPKK
jgi:hypothetical protein